jgi:hypothetical protein
LLIYNIGRWLACDFWQARMASTSNQETFAVESMNGRVVFDVLRQVRTPSCGHVHVKYSSGSYSRKMQGQV